jgi:NADH:ubiquinone oxidoreductase subunit 2 (subunit N)
LRSYRFLRYSLLSSSKYVAKLVALNFLSVYLEFGGIWLSMLILLFVISGAVFLMSTNDLVSIFLSIELQSYGLYLLSTIYRNSELSTTGGLIYFLLGGLSSCFILLGTSLLYVNSGTTSMDSLYILNSISDANDGVVGLTS